MPAAPLPENENERLKALRRYDILDTEAEVAYDNIVELASYICETPIALVSLVDDERQWFKAKVGLDAEETHRNLAFCAHAIHDDKVLEVENAAEDARFSDNALVSGAPNIRFYAGAPIITNDGHKLGTLCAMDTVPKKLNDKQRSAMQSLARQVQSNFELRYRSAHLKQLNETKNKFFSILSHDIRSPVKSIMGLCEYLKRRAENMGKDELKEVVEHLNRTSETADKLIHDILDWAQFDRGEMRCEPRNIELKAVVDEIVELLGPLANKKGIHLSSECDEAVTVFADGTMLRSIIQNLVSNALKFTHRNGSVTIRCKTDADKTCIDVKDTGIGLSQSALESVFSYEKSYSTEGTSGENGSGLGLSLCRQFTEKMKGSINLISEENAGTAAHVVLPSKES